MGPLRCDGGRDDDIDTLQPPVHNRHHHFQSSTDPARQPGKASPTLLRISRLSTLENRRGLNPQIAPARIRHSFPTPISYPRPYAGHPAHRAFSKAPDTPLKSNDIIIPGRSIVALYFEPLPVHPGHRHILTPIVSNLVAVCARQVCPSWPTPGTRCTSTARKSAR